MGGPAFESLAPLGQIDRLVIGAGHPCEVTRHVIDDGFDDVRLGETVLVESGSR